MSADEIPSQNSTSELGDRTRLLTSLLDLKALNSDAANAYSESVRRLAERVRGLTEVIEGQQELAAEFLDGVDMRLTAFGGRILDSCTRELAASEARAAEAMTRIEARTSEAAGATEQAIVRSLAHKMEHIETRIVEAVGTAEQAIVRSLADKMGQIETRIGDIGPLIEGLVESQKSLCELRDKADEHHTTILAVLLNGQNELRTECAEIRHWVTRAAFRPDALPGGIPLPPAAANSKGTELISATVNPQGLETLEGRDEAGKESLPAVDPSSEFDVDAYPGRPKILFIAWPNTPHTHQWINLMKDTAFNVRVFCLESTDAPAEWWPRCYVTAHTAPVHDSANRRTVYPGRESSSLQEALARVIRDWHPDIVHTLGIDPASFLYRDMKCHHPDIDVPAWIVQARGGPDTIFARHSPVQAPILKEIFATCTHYIADNQENYDYAVSAGLDPKKIHEPGMGIVPGPGGLDLDALRARWTLPPSRRERVIVWPKAYDTHTAKANPVFEAILLAWEKIQPCRIEMLWMDNPQVRMWYHRLFSEEQRLSCIAHERLSHEETLGHIAKARVLLAPSLLDGIPNAMMEAMALGAVPIVSPLETITPVVKSEENVLFARNLYPQEIADALIRAMSDDELVDRMAGANLARVRQLADRRVIRRRALKYYEEVARQARAVSNLTTS